MLSNYSELTALLVAAPVALLMVCLIPGLSLPGQAAPAVVTPSSHATAATCDPGQENLLQGSDNYEENI